jgi:hypothetical protein
MVIQFAVSLGGVTLGALFIVGYARATHQRLVWKRSWSSDNSRGVRDRDSMGGIDDDEHLRG